MNIIVKGKVVTVKDIRKGQSFFYNNSMFVRGIAGNIRRVTTDGGNINLSTNPIEFDSSTTVMPINLK